MEPPRIAMLIGLVLSTAAISVPAASAVATEATLAAAAPGTGAGDGAPCLPVAISDIEDVNRFVDCVVDQSQKILDCGTHENCRADVCILVEGYCIRICTHPDETSSCDRYVTVSR